jgi:hypothetical protein
MLCHNGRLEEISIAATVGCGAYTKDDDWKSGGSGETESFVSTKVFQESVTSAAQS